MTAAEVARILAEGRRPQRARAGWLTWCPAHDDKKPSLSVSDEGGRLLVHCHAGCSQDAVIAALKKQGLWSHKGNGVNGSEAEKDRAKKNRATEASLGDPEAIYSYHDANGRLLLQVCRFRKPDGDKTFRQRRPDPENPDGWIWGLSAGEYYRRKGGLDWYKVSGQPPAGAEVKYFPECARVIYRLPEILAADPATPVFIPEGEKDCDNLAALGLVATCNPMGAGKWLDDFNQYFRGRRVVILPDNDPPGKAHALKVAQSLHRMAASIKVVNLLGLSEKGDVSDWLDAGGTADKLLALAEAASEWEPPNPGDAEPPKGKRESQAELLVKLADEAELFHDPARKAYATIPVEGHYETWPVQSGGFRGWLRERFFRAYGKPPASQALQDAIEHLAARALFDGPQMSIFVRVAHIGDRVWVDLVDPEWRAVEISPQGWRVVQRPPVKFLRKRGLAPLPVPEPGGTLTDLRPFINCRDEEWPLVVAWLVGALSPGPYSILVLQGEQGSAKTTTARVLKALGDPSVAPQRAAPRDERDLMISAANSWALSFDNLSGLPRWLSDALCRLATGGGLGTRELYSDADEVLFDAMRPIILNGIEALAEKGDLAERVLAITCPPIPEEARRTEIGFWQEFTAAQPRILGALYTAVSTALANRDRVTLLRLPRMADFAVWVTAAEPALPWEPGTFMAAYERNRASLVDDSLEADPVALAVLALMEDRNLWQGTASELLDALEGLIKESTLKSKQWPKAPNALSNRLRRAAPSLRAKGVEIRWRKSGDRFISIRKDMKKTAQTAQTAQTQNSCGDGAGRSMDDGGQNGRSRPSGESGPSARKPKSDVDMDDPDDLDDLFQDFSNEFKTEMKEEQEVEWRI